MIALVVQTDESGGKPPLHGSTNGGSATPAVRVATALAIARIVDALHDTSCHAMSLRPPLSSRPVSEPCARILVTTGYREVRVPHRLPIEVHAHAGV